MIGIVSADPFLARIKNSNKYALMLQVKFPGNGKDVRTIQYMAQSGEDTVPVKDSIVGIVDIGGVLLAVASYDGISSTRSPGEKEFYAVDGTTKKVRFVLKKTGKAYLGNATTGQNLRVAIENVIDAMDTLANGLCVTGSPLTTAAAVKVSLNTAKTYLVAFLDNAS